VGLFRQTTGGDLIEAEIKGANKTLNFKWGGKHIFDANDLPKAEGDADQDAFYNRLCLIAFSKQVPQDQIDRTLGDKLATERSGILNWMLDGLDRLETQKGFTDGNSIEEIKEQYKRASDSVYCFVVDLCEIAQGEYVSKSESYRRYTEYCIKEGFSPKGKTTFYEQLMTKMQGGIRTGREKVEGEGTPQVWMNLRINSELTQLPESSTIVTNNTTNLVYPSPTPVPTPTPLIDFPKAGLDDPRMMVNMVTLVNGEKKPNPLTMEEWLKHRDGGIEELKARQEILLMNQSEIQRQGS